MRCSSLRYVAFLTCSLVFSGCATTGTTGDSSSKQKIPELAALMSQAGAAEQSATKALAVSLYEEAAKLYPSSKLPWVRVAQIQYESLNYGEAIVAAEQAVARDGKDKVAQSILAVSGLRVSTKALADLGRQNELDGTLKSEAQNLARLIREALGERVLVPSGPQDSSRTNPSPARPAAAKPGTSVPKAAQAPEKRSGNPFDALK